MPDWMRTISLSMMIALCLWMVIGLTGCAGGSASDDEPAAATLELLVTSQPFALDSLPLHQRCDITLTARDAQGSILARALPVKLWVDPLSAACAWLLGDTLTSGADTLVTTTDQLPRLAGMGAVRQVQLRARLLDTEQPISAAVPWNMGPYPPAFGTLGCDPTGTQVGGSQWRLRLSAHIWDPFSADLVDAVWTRWFVDQSSGQPSVALEQDSTLTDSGSAVNGLIHHCEQIGDTLQGLWAEIHGLLPDESGTSPSGWVWGTVRIALADPGNLDSFFRLPFQSGGRTDNLSLALQNTQVAFPPNCGGPAQQQDIAAQLTLVDGYGCAVGGFDLYIWSAAGGVFTPAVVRTDENGVATAMLTVDSGVLQPLGLPCPAPQGNCEQMAPLSIDVGASLMANGSVQAQVQGITLTQPCPE